MFVQELAGIRPDLATLGGFAFSVTGLAGMIAVPLIGKHSDEIGYRRVLLICLAGATLTSLPQAFAGSYWAFVLERFGVGLFIGGILPTANALIGRMAPRGDRGTIYGMTASATFLGNSMGPLTGGAIAASFGLRWVFLITAALLLANLVWVYFNVPEYVERAIRRMPISRWRPGAAASASADRTRPQNPRGRPVRTAASNDGSDLRGIARRATAIGVHVIDRPPMVLNFTHLASAAVAVLVGSAAALRGIAARTNSFAAGRRSLHLLAIRAACAAEPAAGRHLPLWRRSAGSGGRTGVGNRGRYGDPHPGQGTRRPRDAGAA